MPYHLLRNGWRETEERRPICGADPDWIISVNMLKMKPNSSDRSPEALWLATAYAPSRVDFLVESQAICSECKEAYYKQKLRKRRKTIKKVPTEGLADAQKSLEQWERKATLAFNKVRTYRRMTKYYTRRIEEENAELREQLTERDNKGSASKRRRINFKLGGKS